LRIDKTGRADLGQHLLAAERVGGANDFAVALGPAHQQAKREPMAERRRVSY
jgi:hypothetical protein